MKEGKRGCQFAFTPAFQLAMLVVTIFCFILDTEMFKNSPGIALLRSSALAICLDIRNPRFSPGFYCDLLFDLRPKFSNLYSLGVT